MLRLMLLLSRQGKVRLTKWYMPYTQKQKSRIIRDITNMVIARQKKMCNFIEWNEGKVIYKRYASLFFVTWVDPDDNELLALEMIHHYVEILDRFFGNVCELDLIFNFHKAYYILDELIIAGELQETSKKAVLRACANQDVLMDPKSADQAMVENLKRTGLYME